MPKAVEKKVIEKEVDNSECMENNLLPAETAIMLTSRIETGKPIREESPILSHTIRNYTPSVQSPSQNYDSKKSK